MEEVKKKIKAKKIKIDDDQLEEVEKVEEKEVKKIEKAEAKDGEKPREKHEVKEKDGKDKEVNEEEPKKKKGWKVFLAMLIILIVLGGALFAVKTFLTATTETTVSVELSGDARGFSNYFKEYLLDRVKAERLFSYSFRNLSNDEILEELSELKDGFSKVSRGLSGSYRNSDYKEIAEVMENDSSLYLTTVRELRTVMTDDYDNDGDRQLAFIRKIEETTKDLRSALYIAQAAFDEDVSGLSSKGVILFDGTTMVEVGGGVMNILVGDFSENVTAVTTDDMEGAIKLIEAKKLYGFSGARLFEIGEGLNAVFENGWVKKLTGEVGNSDVKLTTTKISLVMKNLWGLNEELEKEGIKGLVNTTKKTTEERLNEVVKGLKGAR